MTCPACNHPVAMTINVLVYRCMHCGQEYTFAPMTPPASYVKTDGKPGPLGTYGPSETTFPVPDIKLS